MNDLTVIYYTSNREDQSFEARIQKALLGHAGDLPIISVSQQPIDLGKNICVGDVGLSTHNIRRQFLIGARAANTRYVCTAEADFLYPREYFMFRPPADEGLYFADHLYVLFKRRRKCAFRQKSHSEGGVVASRDYAQSRVESLLAGRAEWETGDSPGLESLGPARDYLRFHTEIPLVTFKTRRGMSLKCPHSEKNRANVLPYWGSAKDMSKEYLA